MKDTNRKDKRISAELLVYELLGIRVFRRFILFVERIKHRKDGLKNHNYHPRDLSYSTLNSFSGYLLYNLSFHIVSLALTVFLLVFCFVTKVRSVPYYIAVFITIVFNVYCLMLQRYIYLKINKYLSRKSAVRNARILKNASIALESMNDSDKEKLISEFEVIERIRRCFVDGGECTLEDSDIPALERIAERIRHIRGTGGESTTDSEYTWQKTEINSKDKKVSRLQNLLGVEPSRNVLFHYTVITGSDDVERLYRRIFPSDLRDRVEMTVETLCSAYIRRCGRLYNDFEKIDTGKTTGTTDENKKCRTVHHIC